MKLFSILFLLLLSKLSISQRVFISRQHFEGISQVLKTYADSPQQSRDVTRILLDSWREDGKLNLKESIRTGQLKELVEKRFENVASPLCASHMTQFVNEFNISLENFHFPATWAIQMLDAWGGIPDGILSGHVTSPGDFPECLQIRGVYTDPVTLENSTFKGRYVTSYLVPILPGSERVKGQLSYEEILGESRNLQLRESVSIEEFFAVMSNLFGVLMIPLFGHCFPSSCTGDDAQGILSAAFNGTIIFPTVIYTAIDEKEDFDNGDITMIVFLGIIGGLCFLGTAIDLFFLWNGSSQASTRGFGLKALLSFSLYTNTIKWLNTKTGGGDNFGCLHGLRFLSMAWVVLCHTFLMASFTMHWNLVDLKKMYADNWTNLALLNGFVSVDTFFTISGTLASYGILKALDKSKGRLNVPMLYLHRYIRLTPTYLILMGLLATLFPYLSDGPGWYIMETESRACEFNLWHNILYVSNFINYNTTNGDPGTCFGEGWYLANDMQFFILSPFIIYPLWRWKKIGLGFLGVLSLGSIVAPAVITGVKDLPPSPIMFIDQKTQGFDVYSKPWTRIGPYLVGIFLGYLLYSQSKTVNGVKKPRPKIPPLIIQLGWTVVSATAPAIIFGIRSYFDPAQEHTDATRAGAFIYAGLHRFSWGMVIAWIIYACVNGYGGWINDFLSWKPFIPLGRLTFCVYISSLHIQMLFHTTTMHPWHFSTYLYTNLFFAHLVVCLLVGYILTITFESPFIQLEKLIFQQEGRKGASPKPPTQSASDANQNSQAEDKGKV